MKIPYLLLILIMCFCQVDSYCQWMPEMREDLSNVEQIKTRYLKPIGLSRIDSSFSVFEDGRIVQTQNYFNDSTIKDNWTYKEKKRKLIVEQRSTSPKRNATFIYKYDKKGRLRRYESPTKGRMQHQYYQSKFKYDEKDRMTSYRVTNVNFGQKAHSVLEIVYPTPHSRKRITRNDDNQVSFEVKHQYDPRGKSGRKQTTLYEYTKLEDMDQVEEGTTTSSFLSNPYTVYESDTILIGRDSVVIDKMILTTHYEYDDGGNYTLAYYIDDQGGRVVFKTREIKYRDVMQGSR